MISTFLNRITMYRLMLYYLLLLWVLAIVFSAAGWLPYAWLDIFVQGVFFGAVCWASNQLIGALFKVKPNTESQSITALILTLIVGPLPFVENWLFLLAVPVIAMASKYILVWKQRHIFNPAAVSVVITALLLGEGASWWVGSAVMFPFLLIGGVIILAKIKRFAMVGAFLLTYIVGLAVVALVRGTDAAVFSTTIGTLFVHTSLLFFGAVMLVEPLTSPTVKKQRIWFAVLAAALLVLYQTFLSVGYTLELALITANLYALAMRTEGRVTLTLKKREDVAQNITKFSFEPSTPIRHKAGQYVEWTLPHPHPDDRGIRRYFTIASSPTENLISLVTKFATDRSSTFKSALSEFKPGDKLIVSHLEGDFVLPDDTKQPIVFIAGGIGVTPFLSMLRYLHDSQEMRDIHLLYSARTSKEFVGQELFQDMEKLGVKTTLTVSEAEPDWQGATGMIDEAFIHKYVPDWQARLFYVSGPEPMVHAFMTMLAKMGLPKDQLKHDDFPGYDTF